MISSSENLCSLRFGEPGLLALYERPLALIRPDHHVAWRGDAVPDDPGRILDVVTGR